MKTFEIWMEGFAATGQNSGASFHGTRQGETFKEAVDALMENWSKQKPKEVKVNYNPKKLSYWGCRFYDNEVDARKSFG